MTIQDLPKNILLSNIKVKTPEGWIGIWISQWAKGVWLKKENDENSNRIYPVIVENLEECLKWEVVE